MKPTNVYKELQRRNVFKVATVYAIAAWLIIQISATVFPRLNLPDWTITFVIVLIALGFPIALIIAWAFELTPDFADAWAAYASSIAKNTPDHFDMTLDKYLSEATKGFTTALELEPENTRALIRWPNLVCHYKPT